MSKLYGSVTIAFGVILSLALLGVPIMQMVNGQFSIGSIIYMLVFAVPIYMLLKRAKKILINQVAITCPEPWLKKCAFYFGGTLLVFSALIIVVTLIFMAFVIATETAGIPVGMGLGFAIVPFVAGSALVEKFKKIS